MGVDPSDDPLLPKDRSNFGMAASSLLVVGNFCGLSELRCLAAESLNSKVVTCRRYMAPPTMNVFLQMRSKYEQSYDNKKN